jgi:hypothetical protein
VDEYQSGPVPKSPFVIQLADARVTCPPQQAAPIVPGAPTVHFDAAVCQPCALRAACTVARGGRSIAIHPCSKSLRERQQEAEGRTPLRQRTTIEHSWPASITFKGPKARYNGIRKNTLDVRRVAVVASLQRLARFPEAALFPCSSLG